MNVLWDLAESLRKGNVRMASVRCEYTLSPAKPGIRVFLDSDGRVTDMAIIPKEAAGTIRHWQPSPHEAFPSGNVASICLGSSEEGWMKGWEKKLKEAPAGNAEEFFKALEETGFKTDPKSKERDGAGSLPGPAAPDMRILLAPFLRGAGSFRKKTATVTDNPALASVLAVADRLDHALESGRLYEDLKRAFIALCESDLESGMVALPLFSGKGDKGASKVSVFFDLDVGEVVASPYVGIVQEELGRALLSCGGSASQGTGKPDAYGLTATGCDEILGKANLGVLGPRILYSLNPDLPALGRYKQIGDSAFCIGGGTRQRIKDAVEWIVDRDREGKTWARVQKFCGYDNGILCAYVEDPGSGFMGESLANPTVRFLCAAKSDDDDDAAPAEETSDSANLPDGEVFQTVRTHPVITALKGVVEGHPAARIRTFVLANVDPGRTRAMVERSIPGSEFIAAAERWQEGAANIPSLMPRIPLVLSKSFKTRTGGLEPRPSEVTCLLDQRWLRDGLDWSMDSGSAFADGIDLLLGRAPVARLLHLAVENGSGLLAEWGRVVHLEGPVAAYDFLKAPVGKPNKPKKMGFNRTEWLVKFPALLGILLAASGRRKETYMKDAPYLIGQLLAAADRLHERYCRRDDPKAGLPSKLLGNSLVVTAGRNPQRALAMLQERFPIYRAWADGAGDGLGLWAANRFGEAAEKLVGIGIPASMTDADRAELLLGYAAGINGKKAASTTESKEEANANEEDHD